MNQEQKEIIKKIIGIFEEVSSDTIDMLENADKFKEIVGYDILQHQFSSVDFNIDLTIKKSMLEDYLNFDKKASINCLFAIEDANNITATPLFYSPSTETCITYCGDYSDMDSVIYCGDYSDMDSVSYVKNTVDDELIRASHHDFLSSFHGYFISFEDSIVYRLILEMIGFYNCFPIIINFDDNKYIYQVAINNEFINLESKINEDLYNFLHANIK